MFFILIVLSALTFLASKAIDDGFTAIISMLLLGSAFVVRLGISRYSDPAAKRAPGWVIFWRGLACIAGAFLLLASVDVLFAPAMPSDLTAGERNVRLVGLWFNFIWPWFGILPLLRRLAEPRHGRMQLPFWPVGFGIVGGSMMAFGLFLAWIGFGERAVLSLMDNDPNTLFAAISLPLGGLFGGVGLAYWRRAIKPGDEAALLTQGMFGEAMVVTAAAALGGTFLCLFVAAKAANADRFDLGLFVAACLTALMSITWAAVLPKLRRIEPASDARAIMGVAMIALALPLSFVAPGSTSQLGGWTELALFIVVPLTLGTKALITLTFLPMLRRFLTGKAEARTVTA